MPNVKVAFSHQVDVAKMKQDDLQHDLLKSKVMSSVMEQMTASQLKSPNGAAGFDFDLHIKWKDANGNLILT